MKNDKTIKVCPDCENPLIWTFYNDYNEYFCLNCGYMHGMMGAGDDVPLTKELKLKQRILEAVWKQLYGKGWLLPNSNYGKKGCAKCLNEGHNHHLSKKEREENEVAHKMLEQLKDFLTPKV